MDSGFEIACYHTRCCYSLICLYPNERKRVPATGRKIDKHKPPRQQKSGAVVNVIAFKQV